jgi:hypothetical protein
MCNNPEYQCTKCDTHFEEMDVQEGIFMPENMMCNQCAEQSSELPLESLCPASARRPQLALVAALTHSMDDALASVDDLFGLDDRSRARQQYDITDHGMLEYA